MYIDLLSIKGKYRGVSNVSRGLETVKSTKKWREYFEIYEKYMEWLSKMDNTYSDSVLQMLIVFRDERIRRGAPCEIIFYSEKPDEFHIGNNFLGFDVFWPEEGFSGIADYNLIDECYGKKLNENGLFTTFEDAQEFCKIWKEFINSNDPNSWVIDSKVVTFCVWLYRD